MICNRCKKDKSDSDFISKNNKITKKCNHCRTVAQKYRLNKKNNINFDNNNSKASF